MEFPGTVESSKEGGEESHRVGSEISTEQKMGYTSPAEAVLWWLDSFVTSVLGAKMRDVTRLWDTVCAAAAGRALRKETKQYSIFF